MNEIILMGEDKDTLLRESLYDVFEQLKEANDLLVLHVTKEEFALMKKQISCCGLLDERLVGNFNIEYNKYRYMMVISHSYSNIKTRGYMGFLSLIDNSKDVIKIENYDKKDEMGSYEIRDGLLEYYPDKVSFSKKVLSYNYDLPTRIYTTETFDNVISYYTKLNDKLFNEDTLENNDIKVKKLI